MNEKRRKLPWTLFGKFRNRNCYTVKCQDDYASEKKYINSLSSEEVEWLHNFNLAYYYRDSKSANKIGMPVEMLRDSYNKHRGIVNDIFTRQSHCSIEELEQDNKPKDN